MLTAAEIKTQALALGFNLCGVAPADQFPELSFLDTWLESGYAGEMAYMARTAKRRGDIRRILPSARSVVSLGTVYNTDHEYSTERADPNEAGISRYAWGADYHDVVGGRTHALLGWMRETSAEPFDAKAYVDTGPVQERVFAQYAGLGGSARTLVSSTPNSGRGFFSQRSSVASSSRPTPPPWTSVVPAPCVSKLVQLVRSSSHGCSMPRGVSRTSPSS